MATQIQSAVSSALQELGFEVAGTGMPGSPVELKVTDNALALLKGKTLTIDSNGQVVIG